MTRQAVLAALNRTIRQGRPIIGVSVGAGLAARNAAAGGADLLLALNSGRFRQMGFSSLAGMMPFGNSNRMVAEFGSREILRVARETPVIFGMCASDPMIDPARFIAEVYEAGFSGINNFPTVGIIDGQFRIALEETKMGYDHEVEAIALARRQNIFTVAFVFDKEQAAKMARAGADVICAHLGFTRGGVMGAKRYLPLKDAARQTQVIFDVAEETVPGIIKLVYGGPIKTPGDAEYLYNSTNTMGYIGGSSFDRIPTEEAITHITDVFKSKADAPPRGDPREGKAFYVEYIRNYVAQHYAEPISLNEIADQLHLNRSYLSSLLTEALGCGFLAFVAKYRVKRAKELMALRQFTLAEVAEMVGFSDPAHFSKTFKKHTGQSPSGYIREIIS